MRVCHKRRELVLDPEELVYRIIVPLPFFTLDLALDEPIEHMGGKTLRRRLPIQRILAQLRQIALPPVEFMLLMRRRFVIEFPIVAGDTELLDQPEHGE